MKTTFTLSALTIAAVVSLSTSTLLRAEDTEKPAPVAEESESMVIIDGVVPGKFTHDYDAAIASAKENKLPVMLVFTGSDWCGWCKLMDKNVFSKPEWTAYAKDNLVQVWLDYPKNKDLVPEKYRERNDKLKDEYKIGGYPTYIILDSDGNKLGKLGAGRDKTPESFIAELKKLLLMTESGISTFAANLKPEDGQKVKQVFAEYRLAKAQKAELEAKLSAVNGELKEKKTALDEAMETGKVNAMSELQKAEYDAAKAALAEAEAKLQEWMKTNRRAKVTQELRKQYNDLNKAVQQAQTKVDTF